MLNLETILNHITFQPLEQEPRRIKSTCDYCYFIKFLQNQEIFEEEVNLSTQILKFSIEDIGFYHRLHVCDECKEYVQKVATAEEISEFLECRNSNTNSYMRVFSIKKVDLINVQRFEFGYK